MFGLSFQMVLVRVLAFAVVATVLGLSMALVARLSGDAGPEHDGRLSPSPLRHCDLPGLVSGVCIAAGWTRLLMLEVCDRRGRPVFVALTGMLAVVALGTVIVLLRPLTVLLPSSAIPFALSAADAIRDASYVTVLLNLLPLPPLAAGYILQSLWPAVFKTLSGHVTAISIALAGCAVALQAVFSPYVLIQVLPWR